MFQKNRYRTNLLVLLYHAINNRYITIKDEIIPGKYVEKQKVCGNVIT